MKTDSFIINRDIDKAALNTRLVANHLQTVDFLCKDFRKPLDAFLHVEYLAKADSVIPYYACLPYGAFSDNMHETYSTMIPVHPLCIALPEDEFYDSWREH